MWTVMGHLLHSHLEGIQVSFVHCAHEFISPILADSLMAVENTSIQHGALSVSVTKSSQQNF
eukprot:scaffold366564_cov47-Prasinocladus_malaysianus.AAC.1